MSGIQFTIPRRCPSVHGDNVGQRLKEWRALICADLAAQGVLKGTWATPEEAIRALVIEHLNGPCRLETEFSLRATKNVTDGDNMQSFIVMCFRTEVSSEAEGIERHFGTRPWFYYEAYELPADLDFVQWHGRRRDGQPEDLTRVRVERVEGSEWAVAEGRWTMWWVYENWTAVRKGKAIIHKSACSFCNGGRGIHAQKSARNGRWVGPFDSEACARAAATKSGRALVRRCQKC